MQLSLLTICLSPERASKQRNSSKWEGFCFHKLGFLSTDLYGQILSEKKWYKDNIMPNPSPTCKIGNVNLMRIGKALGKEVQTQKQAKVYSILVSVCDTSGEVSDTFLQRCHQRGEMALL